MQDSLLKIPSDQDWATEWASYIPDAARSNGDATVAYPYGTRGGVANPYSGQSIFAFVDGHAKSLKPEATNPNGDLQPQNNMWDATR
jgi:prepilin-type processing-associated H-X9-DG protein